MQTVGDIVKSVDREIHLGWQHFLSWAKTVITKESALEVLFLSLTLTLCALVVFFLHKAVQKSVLMGI